MGFFQNIWTFGGNLYDGAKLYNPDRIMNFLREMKELLKIKDAAPYVLGGTFNAGQPHEEKYVVGGAVGSSASVLIETWPSKTELMIQVFHDNIPQEILDQVGAAAERIFSQR